MSVVHPIIRFKTGTFTITRTASGTPSLGRQSPGSSTTFNADLSIQPVTGRDLQVLPEARHAEDIRKVWTRTELFTQKPGFEPDTFQISGETFEVFKVETWPHHFVAFAARQVRP